MVRWFDHYLKGDDNGVESEPAVRYYVMGAVGEEGAPGNVWRTAADFPPRAAMTPLYLQCQRRTIQQIARRRDGGSTSYTSDPLHPMEIPGTGFPGAKDARAFEQQAEVRTFTTEPLERAGRMDGPGAGRAVRLLDGARHRLHRPRQRCLSRRPLDPDRRLSLAGPLSRGLRQRSAAEARRGRRSSPSTSAGSARSSTRATASASRSPARARRSMNPIRKPANR